MRDNASGDIRLGSRNAVYDTYMIDIVAFDPRVELIQEI